jgi:hypothetical protein
MDKNNLPQELYHPKTLNITKLTEYLGRELTFDERYIIEDYKTEKIINNKMDELYDQCYQKKLYVPLLTNLDGDCMFETLVYHLFNDEIKTNNNEFTNKQLKEYVSELRTVLSIIMYIYKDYKNFFPNQSESLSELFNLTNEVKQVSCKKIIQTDVGIETINEFYKYTYEVMCQDLSNNHSWGKLPTELIMMVISYLYKIEFIVITNLGPYEHKINVYGSSDNQSIKTIYVGHLFESHYLPIDILTDISQITPLFYRHGKNRLIQWMNEMERQKINMYYESLQNTQYTTPNISLHRNEINNIVFDEIDLSKVNDIDDPEIQYGTFFN